MPVFDILILFGKVSIFTIVIFFFGYYRGKIQSRLDLAKLNNETPPNRIPKPKGNQNNQEFEKLIPILESISTPNNPRDPTTTKKQAIPRPKSCIFIIRSISYFYKKMIQMSRYLTRRKNQDRSHKFDSTEL